MKPVTEYRKTRFSGGAAERGAVLVEFAIIAPLVVLLLMGIADLGIVIHEHQLLQNAAREGARFASLPSSNPLNPSASVATIKQRVVNYCANEKLVITTANVTVNQVVPITVTAPGGTETVTASQVSVSYTDTNILFPGLPLSSVTLTGFSVFRNLY
jgi:Flp pilus assembly protein TadG